MDTERTPLLQETVSDVEEAEEYTLDHLESALEHLEPFASHTPSLIGKHYSCDIKNFDEFCVFFNYDSEYISKNKNITHVMALW